MKIAVFHLDPASLEIFWAAAHFLFLVYIALNIMVRAGVVDHPKIWPFCGYNEIQNPPSRYRTIDLDILVSLT